MALPNYYEILEVPFDANPDTIRQTFRDAVKRFHPDSGQEWSFHFSLITDAYKTLRDPLRREAYDKALRAEYPYYASAPRLPEQPYRNGTDYLSPDHAGSVYPHAALIDRGTVVTGHVSSIRDLIVKGEVHGTLRAAEHRLIVGKSGKVGISTYADEIEIWGRALGELRARTRVILRRGCRVTGEIQTPRLVMEDGAQCSVKVEMKAD